MIGIVAGVIFLIDGIRAAYHNEISLNELGDYIGGTAGALWTAAGLFILYLSFDQQKKDVRRQGEIIELQQFESNFYSLLSLYLSNIQGFDYGKEPDKKTGKDCFEIYFSEFKNNYYNSEGEHSNKLEVCIKSLFEEYPLDISLFSNSITNLLDYCKKVKDSDKRSEYLKTVYGQLTNYEVVLIYYLNQNSGAFNEFILANDINDKFFTKAENGLLKLI